MSLKKITVHDQEYGFVELTVTLAKYQETGNLAVLLDSNYGPWAKLSVNIAGLKLEDNEFVVPVRNITPELLEDLKKSEVFVDTGKTVSYGFVENDPIWKIKS